MSNFSFLNSLRDQAVNGPAKPKLTNGIKYEQYDVNIHNGDVKTVYIPLREAELFEDSLNSLVVVTEVSVQKLLRIHNGVTEI